MRRRFSVFLFIAIGLIAVTVSYALRTEWRFYPTAPPLERDHATSQPPNEVPNRFDLPASSHENGPTPARQKNRNEVPNRLYLTDHPSKPRFTGITGGVVNNEGRRVVGARVHASPFMGITYVGYTDRRGVFTIKEVEAGTYTLSVSKEHDGYGDTFDRFYSEGFVKLPKVTVDVGQIVSCGDLHLGPKAGKLVGTLRDATTKKGIVSSKPMQTRHVILCRLDDPKNCSDASPNRNGDFEILVPPAPFTIEATAPGYEKKDLGSLRLKGGEMRRLDILLTVTN